ncbi:PhzF family phenazine biosynthesis protein [Mucilaginibacter arboris]|uniref:PhzF family phenazine biosynthesis isomerase n=1 Tax=Mucilaginibacter arboris TaxID=2682090 RepID=A0A7K1T012_9SPHI|nr:PhzF family phenazine biosynthesis protein [Mucilaginibacter arboris]MVN22893.1 PhzF family phenazine biosynthesis isomerase [Mucilaginibacter arboris]
MTIPIYQADAFTNRLFGGNPAAVCPLKEWLPDETMQQIALENNLAETAFFVPDGDGFMLRWFTPELEIDLCGHATLASAHILCTELNYTKEHINFKTKVAGTLVVSKKDELYSLDFPSRPPQTCKTPNILLEALGGGSTPFSIQKSRDYFMVYEKEEDIINLNPDFNLLSKIDTIGVIVTAPGKEVDFVSRFFAPGSGIPEDPVTGSAHCTLIPYWAKRLGKNSMHAFQLSARKGELWCENNGGRVLISGKAITYLRGEIVVP